MHSNQDSSFSTLLKELNLLLLVLLVFVGASCFGEIQLLGLIKNYIYKTN